MLAQHPQSRVSHAYCTPMEHCFKGVSVWAYGMPIPGCVNWRLLPITVGHTHYNNNREIRGTQVVSNQLGYPDFREGAPHRQHKYGYSKEFFVTVYPCPTPSTSAAALGECVTEFGNDNLEFVV